METKTPTHKLLEKDLPDAVVIGALFLHLFVILKYPSLAYADEVMQTLEQGHRWAFGYGIVPWEFRDGVRSWVLPFIFGLIMKATAGFGAGSTPYLIAVRIFLAVCSLPPIIVAMAWAKRARLPYAWVAGAMTAVWFELVYFSGKALTEVFAAWALPVALYYCLVAREDENRRAALFAGLASGLTVGLRLQLAPAVLAVLVYAMWRRPKLAVPLIGGALGVFSAFGLVDAITWSYPFQSYVQNFYVNIVKDKAAWFGVAPWYEYFASLATVWGIAAIPLLLLAARPMRRWPILLLAAGVILVFHSGIAHKEYRFIVPFIVIVVIAAGLGLAQLIEERRQLGVVAAGILMLASFDGARRFDWNQLAPRAKNPEHAEPMWFYRAGAMSALQALSTKAPDMCGVAVLGIGWGWSGGYTYLHRNIPFWDVRGSAMFDETTKFYNVLLASAENGEKLKDYVRGECYGVTTPVCFYQRPGPCEPPGDYSINAYIAAQGN